MKEKLFQNVIVSICFGFAFSIHINAQTNSVREKSHRRKRRPIGYINVAREEQQLVL